MNTEPRDWFKHSVDSNNEPQMRRIKAKFGKLTGYAIYYISIEIMMRSCGFISQCDLETYADDYGIDCDALQKFFDYAVEIEAFTFDGEKYSSDLAQHTIIKRKHISEVRSSSGSLGGKARVANAEPDPVPAKAKPKPEPKPVDDPGTPETQAIIDHANRVLTSQPDVKAQIAKNSICNLSHKQVSTLLEKYGHTKLVCMVNVFYLYKLTARKLVKSDYLAILHEWVEERANHLMKTNPPVVTSQSPDEESGVKWSCDWLPQPDGWSKLDTNERKALILKAQKERMG